MIVYLDTSALLKLVTTEAGSDEAIGAVAGAAVVVTSLITYAEARSALARAAAERRLTRPDAARSRRNLEATWRDLTRLDVEPVLIEAAGDLAERRLLRGMDAIHLASARLLREASSEPVEIASWDRRLRAGASAEAFRLVPVRLNARGTP